MFVQPETPAALAFAPEIGAQRGWFVHQLQSIGVFRRVVTEYAPQGSRAQAEPCVLHKILCGCACNLRPLRRLARYIVDAVKLIPCLLPLILLGLFWCWKSHSSPTLQPAPAGTPE